MEKTTTELTINYIKEHPSIKSCLKKGLINYSSLARLIGKEVGIEKHTTMEAILVASRRFQEKLKGEVKQEEKIKELLAKSELDIKTKIVVFIASKRLPFDILEKLQREIRMENGLFFLLEGSENYTLITQERYQTGITPKIKPHLLQQQDNLALINFKSPPAIEQLQGVISYLTSLFAENEVNIVEFFSCWTDTVFVIKNKDIHRTITFLHF